MKLRQTSADKIRGKLVKYKLGDCFAIQLSGSTYLAAIMTGKFNKYYNLTFIEFHESKSPTLNDFKHRRFFGTRFGSIQNTLYGVAQIMMECNYLDNKENFESVGSIDLIPNFVSAGYDYRDNLDQLLEYYLEEIPKRTEKSKQPERTPEFGMGGTRGRLIETANIINNK